MKRLYNLFGDGMNIGCDIVENERLKNRDKRFIDLVLTEREQKIYAERGFSFLCGRFAAKEAIMKALPHTKEYNFLDFEILSNPDGSPYVTNHTEIKLSISHEKNYTMAVAIINNN